MTKTIIFDKKEIDGKFSIVDVSGEGLAIVNSTTNEKIPDDEPLFLLRGRDKLAEALIIQYRKMCVSEGCNDLHLAALDKTLQKFHDFAREKYDRLKQPGSSLVEEQSESLLTKDPLSTWAEGQAMKRGED